MDNPIREQLRLSGTLRPTIDGRNLPTLSVDLEFGPGGNRQPVLLVSTPQVSQGGLFWLVVDQDDAEYSVHRSRLTVRFGPRQLGAAPPSWWALETRIAGGMVLPQAADAGVAEFDLRRPGSVTGTVQLSGNLVAGAGATGYRAVISAP